MLGRALHSFRAVLQLSQACGMLHSVQTGHVTRLSSDFWFEGPESCLLLLNF